MRRKWTKILPVMIAVSVVFGTRLSVSAEQMTTQTEKAAESVLQRDEMPLPNDVLLSSQENGLNVDYHTQQEIADYMKAHSSALSFSTTYKTAASAVSPYALGELSSETLNSAAELLNIIRYVAGIPYNVTIDLTYSEKAQASALVNAANGDLSHYPSRPNGMSDELYNLGYAGSGSSNIAAGYTSMVQAIKGWMSDEDAGNVDRVGHRRWCLNPTMGKVGFGEAKNPSSSYGKYYAMYAFDRSNSSARGYSGVAWPAQNTPVDLFASVDPWSVSMGNTVLADSVVVTLKCVSNGKTYTFSSSQKAGDFYVNNAGYGQTGCIIFRPKDGTMCIPGTTYQVNITGKYSSGEAFTVDYDVNFFDANKPNSEDSSQKDKDITFPYDYSVTIRSAGSADFFRFVPEKSGIYKFESITDGSLDPVVTIYDANGKQVGSDDDGGDGFNYMMQIELNAGQVYNVASELWSGVGSYIMRVSVVEIYPDKPAIEVPVFQEAKNTAAGVVVSWDEVPDAKLYALYLKKQDGSVILINNRISGTSYTIPGLANGVKVGFVLKAYGNSTWSEWSSTLWTTPQLVVTAPQNVKATAGVGQVTVSWDAVSGAQLYALFLKKSSGEVVLVHNRVSGTSYTVTGLANGTTVGFVVKAYGNREWSGWSATAWATPQNAVVPPANVKATAGNGQVTVSWDAVPGAQLYAVFLKKANGEVVLVQNRVSGTSYTVTGLANGTASGFVVKAYVNREWSGWSTTAWATPKAK